MVSTGNRFHGGIRKTAGLHQLYFYNYYSPGFKPVFIRPLRTYYLLTFCTPYSSLTAGKHSAYENCNIFYLFCTNKCHVFSASGTGFSEVITASDANLPETTVSHYSKTVFSGKNSFAVSRKFTYG